MDSALVVRAITVDVAGLAEPGLPLGERAVLIRKSQATVDNGEPLGAFSSHSGIGVRGHASSCRSSGALIGRP
jgi:hypothetical protein